MQSLLTQATVVVELFSAGYVATSFATYAHRRLATSSTPNVPAIALNKPHRAAVFARSMLPTAVQPTQRDNPTVATLRQACSTQGIRWRDAHGKNKHLKKAEMLAALQTHRHGLSVPRHSQGDSDRTSVPTPPWHTYSVAQLRQACQAQGIRWRDAHSKNKHLKKAEMIVALQRMEKARQLAVKQSTPVPCPQSLPASTPRPVQPQQRHLA